MCLSEIQMLHCRDGLGHIDFASLAFGRNKLETPALKTLGLHIFDQINSINVIDLKTTRDFLKEF